MITHGAQCVCHHQITCKAVHPITSLFCRATVAFIKGERLNQAGEAVGAVPTWNFHSLFMVIKIWGLEIGSMRSSFNLSHNSLLYFQSLTVFQINIHPAGRDYGVEKKKNITTQGYLALLPQILPGNILAKSSAHLNSMLMINCR